MADGKRESADTRACHPESETAMALAFVALALAIGPFGSGRDVAPKGSFLGRPVYGLDAPLVGPCAPYVPQAGDIFLASDQQRWARCGHWLAGGAGVHHSGIIFCLPSGRPALIEAGPFNSIRIEVMDPLEHFRAHLAAGDRVWIRRRAIPLTPDQSARLTAFALAQEGKPFAVWRLVGQLSPFRSRGPLRTWFLGKPHGNRDSYFCSELVVESCVAAGLLDPETARPAATYPRDLFFGRSFNLYLNLHPALEPGWLPPACWCACPPSVHGGDQGEASASQAWDNG
jgi:hypothetical protein